MILFEILMLYIIVSKKMKQIIYVYFYCLLSLTVAILAQEKRSLISFHYNETSSYN
jgi:hypothetical protein